MNRRHFLVTTTSAAALTGTALADTPKVQTMGDILRWLDRLERAGSVRSTSGWTMQAVLEHLSQSIEMSMDGFPQAKPAWFQATAGRAAFTFFDMRGRMTHGLTEPIPGAPPLTQTEPWITGAQRLRNAVARFEAHNGALQPHFAYGALGKADFARAHVLHVANHQDEISVA